jgi:hypothetical protein
MQQAFHIFRKDVRFLRLPIAITLALVAVFAWSHCGNRPAAIQQPSTTLLVLGWWYLAAAVVYKETLVGDRQFWVTRPYRWTSLLAAKALFLLAFLHLPLLAADLAILSAQGFTPSLPTLLWRQAGLAALVTLPAAAIASVTRSVAALAMTSVAALICLLIVIAQFHSFRSSWPAGEWIRGTVIVAALLTGAAATLVCQYALRRTAVGRAVAASGFVFFLAVTVTPPFRWVLMRNISDGLGSIHAVAAEPVQVGFSHVWLRIAGVPAGMRVSPELVSIAVDDAQGHEWRSQWAGRFQGSPTGEIQWTPSPDERQVSVWIQPSGVAAMGPSPVKVRASLSLTVFGPSVDRRIPVDGRTHDTPIGRCSLRRRYNSDVLDMTCRTSEYQHSAVQIDDTDVALGPGYFMEYLSASPILESNVEIHYTTPPGDTVTLKTEPRVRWIHRDVDIPLQGRP